MILIKFEKKSWRKKQQVKWFWNSNSNVEKNEQSTVFPFHFNFKCFLLILLTISLKFLYIMLQIFLLILMNCCVMICELSCNFLIMNLNLFLCFLSWFLRPLAWSWRKVVGILMRGLALNVGCYCSLGSFVLLYKNLIDWFHITVLPIFSYVASFLCKFK